MQKIILIVFLISLSSATFAQKQKREIEYGVAVDYNFQTNGIAPDVRIKIPVYKKLCIAPRLAFYPGYNAIQEIYAGTDISYSSPEFRRFSIYAFLGGYYNYWINYLDFSSKVAQKNNFVLESGAGLIYRFGCWNPFIESRYDTKWKEGIIVAGVKICLSRCKGKYNAVPCPGFSN